ncbi:hypothetical protein AGABI2DRAFT_121930 [Agaricus bisporus var. bisporus H97]|uniref:hypothetical protein n=1 Tax=Agaricus bisporus var. bisporus (strain H97 / ATCC MYA-4626 / FGSC 10389) TaxID=936046 RepID=UPI00029F7800|nr:hypothetical protein AGABI2DRAFT_121930 [Agaricus bisporus var. bisporus H97]EKV43039.1 hypothetical protein AGABI2DRAFT_121930 [Agaricus bisporus var. bisporus H97]
MSGNSQEVDNAEDSYPTQRHAGKVGYGPTYHEGPTLADKVAGYKKELHGKIARKPQLVKEGHEKITGEAKRREREGSDEKQPFGTPGQTQPPTTERPQTGDSSRSSEKESNESETAVSSKGSLGKE